MKVLIQRGNHSETNGKPDPPTVYVTGPHFGGDIFSSTTKVEEASRFEEEEARRLLARGYWRHEAPITVPVHEAKDLRP